MLNNRDQKLSFAFSNISKTNSIVLFASVILIIIMGAGIYLTAARIENESSDREIQLIRNGINIEISRVNGGVESQTLWDDAVLHLDNKLDGKWAKQYLTEYLWANGRYNLIFVLNDDDEPKYATYDRSPISPDRYEDLRQQLKPVIDSVRRHEMQRGPMSKGDPRVPTPIRGHAMVRMGDSLFIATADLVQPDNSIGAAPSRRGAILIAGQRIDRDFLSKIENQYLIHGLTSIPVGEKPKAGQLSFIVGKPTDPTAFQLAWKRNSPTAKLILTAGPALAAVFLALASAPVLVSISGRRERELKTASEAARLASEAKSAFLATLSHEIRTPMNGIIGLAHMMRRDALIDVQRERLETILASSQALVSILNDTLDLSKIEAGKLILENEPFDLADVAVGARNAFAAIATQKGVALNIAFNSEEPSIYLGDAHRIRQILHNLISNAVKFTEHGKIDLSIEPQAECITLTVSDTGCGIAADRIEQLFEKFVQEDASTTRRYGGTGLGLAICRELSAAMGGSISVKSQQGLGTSFTVELPLKRTTRAPGHLAGPDTSTNVLSSDSADNLKVLVAEDNAINQQVVVALLGELGITPSVVEDGAKALEAWSADEWDVILMDVCMPVMDGPTACRHIRSRELSQGRRRTQIIALTPNVMQHQVQDYIDAGMDDIIAKPIQVAELFNALEAAFIVAQNGCAAPPDAQFA
jgi:signal transduction histidine kinase/CheY-like chemotaxis protein